MSYNTNYGNNGGVMERIRIQSEIICETIGDLISASTGAIRKPLILLVGVALVMTFRSARRGVNQMKTIGYTSNGMGMGTFGQKASSSYGTGNSGYATGTTGGTYGGSSTVGYGRSAAVSPTGGYGSATSTDSTLGGYGSSSSLPGVGSIRGASTGTADLSDTHGASLQVLENSMFKDYGGTESFGGQVETLQAFDGCGVVSKVLESPGNGKVLVVDGGANLRTAIFDGTAAENAQRNGWSGVIISGAIRNAGSIGAVSIGVKALGTSPVKGVATSGSKGSAINIGSLTFNPGMWVHADKDGIVLSSTQLNSAASTSSYGAVGSTIGGTTATGGYGTNVGTVANAGTTGVYGANTGTMGTTSTTGGYGATAGTMGTATGGYGSTTGATGSNEAYGVGGASTYGAAGGMAGGYGQGGVTGAGTSNFFSHGNKKTFGSSTGWGKSSSTGYGENSNGKTPRQKLTLILFVCAALLSLYGWCSPS